MNWKYTLPLAIYLLIFSSCRKDVDQFIPLPGDPPPAVVRGALLGKVHAPGGAVVEGAEVVLEGQTSLTDASGLYFLPDASAPEGNAWVEVYKEGFFPGFARITWSEKAEHRADLLLMPRHVLGALPVETGGVIEAPDGLRLTLPPQSLEYSTGAPATGAVEISAFWLDPADPQWTGNLPAGTRGLDAANRPVFLRSFGMLTFDFRDENGLPLQLRQGSYLEIQCPANTSLPLPATLSLWSLDPDAQQWVEGPSASLMGGAYTGLVGRHGYWNLATASPLIQLKGWVFENGGGPARAVRARISSAGDEQTLALGLTQSQGRFAFDLPGNTPMVLQLFDLCGEERYVAELPALSGNLSLNPIQWPAADGLAIQGRLLDCEEEPVELGYVQIIWAGEEVLIPLVDGAFSALLPACPDGNGALIAYDLERQFQTPPLNFSGGNPVNVGDWVLCNDSPEYLSFNLDGSVQYSDAPEVIVSAGVTTISDAFLNVSFSFEGDAAGTYEVLMQDFQLGTWSQAELSALDLLVNISRFDPPGGYVIGSFNGKLIDQDAGDHPVSGVFKLQRN